MTGEEFYNNEEFLDFSGGQYHKDCLSISLKNAQNSRITMNVHPLKQGSIHLALLKIDFL